MNTGKSPDPQFIENIVASLTYWEGRTAHIDEPDIRELNRERRNLYRIVQYGLVLQQTWRSAAIVILQSFYFIERCGYWHEWIPVLEKALAWGEDEHVLLKFKLMNQLGQLHCFARQWAPALVAHKAAEKIAEQLGDEQMLAECYCHLSKLYLGQRKYDQGEKYGLSALQWFTDANAGERWIAITLSTLGELARLHGDLLLSEERLAQAVSYWRLIDEPVRTAHALNNLATTFLAAGKLVQAEQCLKEVVVLLGTTANELDKVLVHINLGGLDFRRENWIGAEAAFQEANSSYLRRSPYIYYRALVATNLGNVLLKQGRLEEATAYLQDAVSLWRSADDNLELANTLGALAETLVSRGQSLDAIPLYEEAVTLLSYFSNNAWAKELHEKFTKQRKTS